MFQTSILPNFSVDGEKNATLWGR